MSKKSKTTYQKKKSQKDTSVWYKAIRIISMLLAIGIVFGSIYLFNQLQRLRNETTTRRIKAQKTEPKFEKEGEIYIWRSKNDSLKIDVEIADTDKSREQGLMYRTKMSQSVGMFFIFNDETPRSFWMRNTIIPLDIIYINSGMKIVKIRQNTIPYSEKQVLSEKPAKYVLEVNAGFASQNELTEGDSISLIKL